MNKPSVPKLSLREQVQMLTERLRERPAGKDATYGELTKWVMDLPPALRTEELITAFGKTFELSPTELAPLRGTPLLSRFDELIPESGWLHDYIELTRQTEAPTVFHYFAGLTAISATMARRSWFPRGSGDIYPNLCVVLVAPSGACRKTSACNISLGLLRAVEVAEVFADKTTPEALIDSLAGREDATGLIYGPELSVFLGKQRYNDGMVPLLTALFDSPALFKAKTVTRGEVPITNVCLQLLGCTTPDWLAELPRDAFGGGFMSRLLFVVQESTERRFPIPPPFDLERRKSLLRRLLDIQHIRGEWTFAPSAERFYIDWYMERKENPGAHKQYAGYSERKPDHLIRLAMCLSATYDRERILTKERLVESLAVLDWLETQLPEMFDQLQTSEAGQEQQRVMQLIRGNGGSIEWTELLRKASRWADSKRIRAITDSLLEARMLGRDMKAKTYYITTQGWKS